MLLDGKAAVVYGGAGAMGSAVAQAFAREGARVFQPASSVATASVWSGCGRTSRRRRARA